MTTPQTWALHKHLLLSPKVFVFCQESSFARHTVQFPGLFSTKKKSDLPVTLNTLGRLCGKLCGGNLWGHSPVTATCFW